MTILINRTIEFPVFLGPNNTRFVSSGNYRYREGVRTPSYASIPKRSLPINSFRDVQAEASMPAQAVATTYISGPSKGQVSYQLFGYSSYADIEARGFSFANLVLPKLPTVAALHNEAFTKALQRLADAKVNLPVAVAEASKTTQLITNTANRIFNAYRSFRKGRFRDTARYLGISSGTVHKTWLEYKYGWMPLLMDVKNAAEFLAQQHVAKPIYLTGLGTASSQASYFQQLSRVHGWRSFSRASITRQSVATREVRVKIYARVVNSQATQLQQLGLTNPALVAWELVPFSFVFDWFISVGDYLQAVTALHGLTVEKAMTSSMTEWSASEQIAEASYVDSFVDYSAFTTNLKAKKRDYTRGSFTVSLLDLSPVRNRDPFSFSKLVTGMALLRSRM